MMHFTLRNWLDQKITVLRKTQTYPTSLTGIQRNENTLLSPTNIFNISKGDFQDLSRNIHLLNFDWTLVPSLLPLYLFIRGSSMTHLSEQKLIVSPLPTIHSYLLIIKCYYPKQFPTLDKKTTSHAYYLKNPFSVRFFYKIITPTHSFMNFASQCSNSNDKASYELELNRIFIERAS